ncbi:hypothetical protein [Achromobacter sp. NFACC18-2]|uniref:hypothetical protein n=1 Tax=Achromobacter sp. NFACC18-2 TaxID=1564112 RepID=UPI0008C93DCE|nr:hypothetical protein [Achromobacter sp. NFACC18-2]SEJ84829.1 hypothetical protein SAMN03159494_03560 [Achromobacter sp. NFACC18-2]
MHVAIKQTVLDKILKRIHEIKRDNREPEYIVVSHEEYAELRADRRWHAYVDYPTFGFVSTSPADVQLTCETRTFERQRGPRTGHPFIKALTNAKLMGYPLYAVPAEFVPA